MVGVKGEHSVIPWDIRASRWTGLAIAGFLISASLTAPALADPAPPPVFARCVVCHAVAKGAPAKIGPNLWGVYGAKAGARANFNYSAALKASGLRWDEATLDKWIAAPMTMVPGTQMAFPGLKDAAKRAEIIAYLKQAR